MPPSPISHTLPMAEPSLAGSPMTMNESAPTKDDAKTADAKTADARPRAEAPPTSPGSPSSRQWIFFGIKARQSADHLEAYLLPPDQGGLYVEDFSRHIRHAEAFHKRWMGSDRAKRDWCERVSRLEIDMLVPQHGSIYQGADVQRFINWFAALEVGVLRG